MTDQPDFSTRVSGILEAGALNVGLGLGYELGLFDALDEAGPEGLSCAALAERTSLSARYVREWLGAMLGGEIVTLFGDEEPERFVLPSAHGDVLCRRAGSGALGVYTQELGLLVQAALPKVRAGFKSGRGLAYSDYPDFHAFMDELADRKHERALVSGFLPTVQGGAIEARLRAGARVCDLGCGAGRAIQLLAEAFPQSQFTGIDLDAGALALARERSEGLGNLEFVQRDASELATDPGELEEAFDWITAFDSIHDQHDPRAALAGARRLLAPGGCFSLVDIDAHSSLRANRGRPFAGFLYMVSLLHCLPVGLGPEGAGAGLGMLWGRERALELLDEAGFVVEVREIPNDPFNVHYECQGAPEQDG